MKYLNLIIMFFLILSQSACSKKISEIVEADFKQTSESVIYIYRPNAMSNAMVSPELLLDDKPYYKIKNNSYSYLIVLPEKYSVRLKLEERYTGVHELSIQLEPGMTRYYRIQTKTKFEMNKPYSRSFNIEQVAQDIAREEMLGLSYVGEESAAKTDSDESVDVIEAHDDAQFSTGKTSNPFSK